MQPCGHPLSANTSSTPDATHPPKHRYRHCRYRHRQPAMVRPVSQLRRGGATVQDLFMEPLRTNFFSLSFPSDRNAGPQGCFGNSDAGCGAGARGRVPPKPSAHVSQGPKCRIPSFTIVAMQRHESRHHFIGTEWRKDGISREGASTGREWMQLRSAMVVIICPVLFWLSCSLLSSAVSLSFAIVPRPPPIPLLAYFIATAPFVFCLTNTTDVLFVVIYDRTTYS